MSMPTLVWVFRAKIIYVVDGDTVDLEIDVGLHGRRIERVRLLGVNAPEVHGDTRAAGLQAAIYVRGWFNASTTPSTEWPIVVQTYKSDVFGRYLATIWRQVDGACLNLDLLNSEHAVVFNP